MIRNITSASKSFLILFLIAFFGTFFCLNLWLNYQANLIAEYDPIVHSKNIQPHRVAPANPAVIVDTSNWLTYTNKTYDFSFVYNPDWKISSVKKQGDYKVIQIDPGKKYYNFKIYISVKDYFALSGIPTQTDSIDGISAITATGFLYGVKANDLYYTFDIGASTVLKDEFDAMVHSVKFEVQ